MITPTKLAGISVASVGIAGGSAGAMYAFWPETISIEKKLIEENKKILGEGNETLWGIKLATYQTLKASNNKIKQDIKDWEGLKNWCSSTVSSKYDEKNKVLYDGIGKVCTVPTHREKFKNVSKELAGTSDWATKAQEYTGTGDKVIVGIKKDSTTAKELETWCGKALEKEYEDDQKNDYPLVLKWCTKAGS